MKSMAPPPKKKSMCRYTHSFAYPVGSDDGPSVFLRLRPYTVAFEHDSGPWFTQAFQTKLLVF